MEHIKLFEDFSGKLEEKLSSVKDLKKAFGKYGFDEDFSMGALSKTFTSGPVEFSIFLRHVDEDEEIDDVTLVVETGDGTYSFIKGEKKIKSFLDNGLSDLVNAKTPKEMDMILTKFKFN